MSNPVAPAVEGRGTDARVPEWGVYDTEEHCWLGTNDAGNGPRTFTDHALARVFEHVLCRSLDYPGGRLAVLLYAGDANRMRDEIPMVRDAREVLDELWGCAALPSEGRP